METSLAAALASGKYIFEFVREIREALRKETIDPNEVAVKLMDLQEKILDYQKLFSDVQEETGALKR